jgi:protein-L-isoaspartate(D-aspartate) O-methyltransferase
MARAREPESSGIHERRVLEALQKVPRHLFVPESLWSHAYRDEPLPIGHGQTISQPRIVALMAEALNLRSEDRVLEVGSGSGYAAAVLSFLAAEVYGIELQQELYERSVLTLSLLDYGNIHVRCGDGYYGWPEEAPFDAILLSCATGEVPGPLWEQVAEGGRLLYPQDRPGGFQQLVLVTKAPAGPREERLQEVSFVPMRH